MKRRLQLNETEFNKLVKRIVEQVEDEYYKISPEEYKDLLKYFSYSGKLLTKYKKFQGKPLWITGDLDISGEPVDTLGNIKYIDGRLDISNTKISNIDGIEVKRYVSDYGSPRAKIREKKELEAKLETLNSYREDDEWNIDGGDETGLRAHALFNYLIDEGEIDPLTDDDREKLIVLRRKLDDLKREYEEFGDDDEKAYDIQESIDETQEEIDELEENNVDVYMMFPLTHSYYGLQRFEVLIPGFKDKEYTVGTYEEMDEAALEHTKSLLDDVGIDGFNESFVQDYLDVDTIVSMAEEDYEYQIRGYPEGWFSESDYELTYEQEKRIEEIESEIEDYEQQQIDLDPEDENYDDYYENFQDFIDELQEELDSIEPINEPTEDMIHDKVAELVRDVERDPLDYLKEHGFDIKEYVDVDALAQGVVDSDGWGVMNSYDGQYESVKVGDETFYVMRIN